ncbi:uncharacterized protein LOC128210993 [Mya arenaria]|uniref:uncharacterized protein LOC128210993 n=1 Tax=Mya arenaria TaxID=6604 RepID=UPI0022DFAE81|nr:uncharacterized protein LOC128210993 [Mya arenaria]
MAMSRKRSQNWSESERNALIDVIMSAKTTQSVSWNEAAEVVNSVGGHGGDAGEVKKKWINLKSVVKKKVMGQLHGHKQTGGGEPIEMNIKDWEEKVLATIPNVSVSGIEGGSTLVNN